MLPLEDSPGSVATTTSSSTPSSASSTPESHSHLKRRSHCTTPMLDVSGVRQLKYSPLRSPSSSPRSRSPVIGRKISSRTLRTTATLIALVGASLFGSFSVLVVPVDLHWVDVTEQQHVSLGSWGSTMNAAPRVVYLERTAFEPIRHRILPDDPTLHSPPGEEATEEQNMKAEHHDPECVPMAKWQTQSFPNCNIIHEMDLREAADEGKKSSTLQLLGTGWFRSTWKWDTDGDASVVLKTLRLDREFFDEYYDLHRRDAVAMERLTHSPFVMNIYGYCGQSALNELADFQWDSLEKFGKNLRGRVGADVNFLKLQLAASVSVGLATFTNSMIALPWFTTISILATLLLSLAANPS
ncbi:serine/threonine kinase [Fragilaria crotonensis]|nr:serine/threonine kinase [Fragilaria crotonensis]